MEVGDPNPSTLVCIVDSLHFQVGEYFKELAQKSDVLRKTIPILARLKAGLIIISDPTTQKFENAVKFITTRISPE